MDKKTTSTRSPQQKLLRTVLVAIFILIACCLLLTFLGPTIADRFNEELADNGQCAEIVAKQANLMPIGAPVATIALPQNGTIMNPTNIDKVTQLDQVEIPNSRLSWSMDVDHSEITLFENPNWRESPQYLNRDGSQLIQIDTYPSEATIVRVCDATNGVQIKAFTSNETTNALAFTPTGQQFILNEGRGTIVIYESKSVSRQERWDVREDGERWRVTNQMAISPNGEVAAFTVREPNHVSIRIWHIQENEELLKLDGHTETIANLHFTPDGKFLISHGMDDMIHIWGIP